MTDTLSLFGQECDLLNYVGSRIRARLIRQLIDRVVVMIHMCKL